MIDIFTFCRPFLDPLVIISAIAFIAFLIQTFHVLYLTHRYSNSVHSTSLLGGVVDNLVPTRHRTLNSNDDRVEDILAAIRLCVSAMNLPLLDFIPSQFFQKVLANKKRKKRPVRAINFWNEYGFRSFASGKTFH